MKLISQLFFEYGLLAMFLIILIEYACFPISSEIVLPFSGAFASIQGIPFFIVLPLSVVAGIIGTCICYGIGSYGGTVIINKIKNKFPKSTKGMDSAQVTFNKYGPIAVCLGRIIPICRTYIAFFAGAAKLNFITYIIASTIGITIWNALLIGLGYIFHSNY
ncbi:MAG TPA: DedA family protein, partial [Clostridiales bacterium]|nr:DedA family protein [Clostridiales bacterium]